MIDAEHTSRPPAEMQPVPLAKAYRLLNHGPTVLVSAAHGGQRNVMAAAWNMALDFEPCKVSVVIDKSTWTRELIEASGRFALNVPARGIASEVLAIGNTSGRDLDRTRYADKFAAFGLDTFAGTDPALPLVTGCVAWLECTLIPEPHNQQRYDLFIGEVTAAWADSRVFTNGHWTYRADTPTELQTLHYVAGGTFLSIGAAFNMTAAAMRTAD
ncbi:MAG TPA: flavin reductase family protein [Casimicrobium huifangae]|jgi:flavin reductase (DIM6/NTAB) family NADH-FMN oxidoreductase RutF|uniref:flavin reductase family protein n=1 Tax=Casimicrobium huifangae TaxID=2591109 RepID=UPI0012EC262A|nr:flavin reductase family protein [Casimicrobium huifangae]HQD66919.1 flavin reductase family protein [Casimicrobium huifangae]